MASEHVHNWRNEEAKGNTVSLDVGTELLGVEARLDSSGKPCAKRQQEKVHSTYIILSQIR